MGFDIIGVSPQSKTGAYFRNGDLSWQPLWLYTCNTCGEFLTWREMEGVKCTNGYHIDEEKTLKISKRLFELLESGETRKMVKKFLGQQSNLPWKVCNACKGTGEKDNRQCRKCDGEGKIGHYLTEYKFDEDNVRAFAEFCSSCGGFIVSWFQQEEIK